jgi:DNA-directed RNA polymerase sigma subunit (sigma70/sigma32)
MNGKVMTMPRKPNLNRRLEKLVAEVFWTDPSPGNHIVMTDATACAIWTGLNKLTVHERDCIRLKYGIGGGKPARYKEIVQHLKAAGGSRNLSREDVRRWIAKGLTKLRRMENFRLFQAV